MGIKEFTADHYIKICGFVVFFDPATAFLLVEFLAQSANLGRLANETGYCQ